MWQGQQCLNLWSGWKRSPESAESGRDIWCFRKSCALAQQHYPFWKNLYLSSSKDWVFGIYSLWDDVDCEPLWIYMHLPNDRSICKRPFPFALTCDPLLQICPWRRVGTAGKSVIGNVNNGIAGSCFSPLLPSCSSCLSFLSQQPSESHMQIKYV